MLYAPYLLSAVTEVVIRPRMAAGTSFAAPQHKSGAAPKHGDGADELPRWHEEIRGFM